MAVTGYDTQGERWLVLLEGLSLRCTATLLPYLGLSAAEAVELRRTCRRLVGQAYAAGTAEVVPPRGSLDALTPATRSQIRAIVGTRRFWSLRGDLQDLDWLAVLLDIVEPLRRGRPFDPSDALLAVAQAYVAANRAGIAAFDRCERRRHRGAWERQVFASAQRWTHDPSSTPWVTLSLLASAVQLQATRLQLRAEVDPAEWARLVAAVRRKRV